jgi:hypothetical protein
VTPAPPGQSDGVWRWKPEGLLLAGFGSLIAFGCVLRFWKLADDGFWYDELWTVVGASDRPFMEVYRDWMRGDAHPPGYFLFYFVWLKLIPNDELWARLPNAIAGAITVLYLLLGTRGVLSRDERFFAAALASFSWLYVFYAVNVKQYSFVILLVTVATISYLRIAGERRLDSRNGAPFAALLVGLAYLNHFAMAYAWVLLALLAFAFRRTRTLLERVGWIAVALAISYAPIAHLAYFGLLYSANTEQSQLATLAGDILPSLFFDDLLFVAAFLVLVTAGLVGSRAELTSTRNRNVLLVLGTFGSLLLTLALVEPIFVLRYFIVLFPVTLLCVAILTAAAFPIGGGWLAVVPLVFFARAATVDFRAVDAMQRQEWRASVDLVLASAAREDAIYVLGADPNRPMLDYLAAGDIDGVVYRRNLAFYQYYFRRRGADDVAARLRVIEPTTLEVVAVAREHQGSGRTVYVVAGHHIQLDEESVWTLDEAASDLETTWLYSTIVYRARF